MEISVLALGNVALQMKFALGNVVLQLPRSIPPPSVPPCEHILPVAYPPLRRRLAAPDPAVKGVQYFFVAFKRQGLFLATRPHSFFKPLLNPGFGGMTA